MAEQIGSRRVQPPRRTLAHFLAPLLLAAAVVVIVLIVSSSTGGSGGGNGSGSGAPARSAKTDKAPSIPDSYVIQPGDSLSQIAEHFNLTVEELQRLNPDLDPQALATGLKLKLKK